MGYCVDMIYNEFQVPSSDKKGNKTCNQMLLAELTHPIKTRVVFKLEQEIVAV